MSQRIGAMTPPNKPALWFAPRVAGAKLTDSVHSHTLRLHKIPSARHGRFVRSGRSSHGNPPRAQNTRNEPPRAADMENQKQPSKKRESCRAWGRRLGGGGTRRHGREKKPTPPRDTPPVLSKLPGEKLHIVDWETNKGGRTAPRKRRSREGGEGGGRILRVDPRGGVDTHPDHSILTRVCVCVCVYANPSMAHVTRAFRCAPILLGFFWLFRTQFLWPLFLARSAGCTNTATSKTLRRDLSSLCTHTNIFFSVRALSASQLCAWDPCRLSPAATQAFVGGRACRPSKTQYSRRADLAHGSHGLITRCAQRGLLGNTAGHVEGKELGGAPRRGSRECVRVGGHARGNAEGNAEDFLVPPGG